MRVAAVNFADNRGWYQDGQRRLHLSLLEHVWIGDYLAFTHHTQLKCPSHQEVPYAFKVHAIDAARRRGYEMVFYGDASIYLVNSWKPIRQHILDWGYYLEATEHNLGTWCSDAALRQMQINREDAFSIPTIVAGCVGFDFRTSMANKILDDWLALAKDGVTFHGNWHNNDRLVSSDLRVRGHRHDQSALSGLAHKLKLKLLPFETFIFYATPPPPHATVHCHATI